MPRRKQPWSGSPARSNGSLRLRRQLRNFAAADAFIWQSERERFLPVAKVNRVPIDLLKSIEAMRDTLLANTERFARGLPANNALLWGARGMGKSSLIKAVHAAVLETLQSADPTAGLKLVEIHREDIASLPACLAHLRKARIVSSSSATIFPSTPTIPPTNRSRRFSKAASKDGRRM